MYFLVTCHVSLLCFLLTVLCQIGSLFLQACPERPAGLHTSAACVAFIEWKLINILEGHWNFRMESTKDGKKNLATFIHHFIIRTARPTSKLVSYSRVTKMLTLHSLEPEAAVEEPPLEADEGVDPT